MSLKNTPKNKKYTEGNNPNEMDMSGNKRQMDDEFKTRFFTLGKMEQKTAEAFYSKRIENEFKWPDPNESKDAGSLRKKANSARLRRERVKQKVRENDSQYLILPYMIKFFRKCTQNGIMSFIEFLD